MTGFDFAGQTGRDRLQMGAHSRAKTGRKREFYRQSAGLILYATARVLPFFAALSGLAWYILRRVLSPLPLFFTYGWSATIPALLLASGWGLSVWLCSDWRLCGDRLLIRQGVFTRREISIHRDAIRSAEVEVTPVTALVGAARLCIRTDDRQCDRLLLPGPGATQLAARLVPSSAGHTHSFRSSPFALWLSAVSGEGLTAFYSAVAPVLSASRDVAGGLVTDELNRIARREGVLVAGGLTLAVIWLLKVVHTRLTHARMTFTLSGGRLMLSRGVISRRVYSLCAESICALDLRTSLSGFLFRRQSCTLILPGQHSCPLLPLVDRRRVRLESAAISPHGTRICTVSPLATGMAYAAGRWAACLALLPFISLSRRLLPSMGTTAAALGITLALLLMWRALVTTISSQRAGLAMFTDCAELTGVNGLSLHTLRVFRQSVGLVRITQWPLSRMLGRCTLRIIPRGNRRAAVSCIKLPFERTETVCEKLM